MGFPIKCTGVGYHFLDGADVGLVSVSGSTQMAGTLGGLLSEDVALISVSSLNLTGLGQVESLLSAAMGPIWNQSVVPCSVLTIVS